MTLIACKECDFLQQEIALPPGGTALCCRCNAPLYRSTPHGLERALICTIVSIILFLFANTFPIIGLELQKTRNATTLFGSVVYLYQHGLEPVAALVFTTTMLVPSIELAAMLYILLPLRLGYVVRGLPRVLRLVQIIHPWGMVEVLMLGILVSVIRTANFATVEPGLALWSFAALMVTLLASAYFFNERDLWACVKAHSPEPDGPSAPAPLHLRKPDSVRRTWAFLLAGFILYIPANLLPIMEARSLKDAQIDTIMSGVIYLWGAGSWHLALIVFVASIVVPTFKLLALGWLTYSVQQRSNRWTRQRARLYRFIDIIGRWSMLDIYVVALLVALVQLQLFATVKAGPAAAAFGAVVVLTLLATHSFDPRLIWDFEETEHD